APAPLIKIAGIAVHVEGGLPVAPAPLNQVVEKQQARSPVAEARMVGREDGLVPRARAETKADGRELAVEPQRHGVQTVAGGEGLEHPAGELGPSLPGSGDYRVRGVAVGTV